MGKIFNVSMEAVTKEMRRKAKTVNFGIIYGQTRFGLASTLGISHQEAQELINKYFATYPKISQYMNETIEKLKERIDCLNNIDLVDYPFTLDTAIYGKILL